MDKFDFEKWLRKYVAYLKDGAIVIFLLRDDIYISDHNCYWEGHGKTLEEACKNYEKDYEKELEIL